MMCVTYIKDYVCYIVVAVCTDDSVKETIKTLNTLRVEGVRINEWMRQ